MKDEINLRRVVEGEEIENGEVGLIDDERKKIEKIIFKEVG